MNDLPDEILLNITSRLPFVGILKVASLCKRFRLLVSTSAVHLSPVLMSCYQLRDGTTSNVLCDEEGNLHLEHRYLSANHTLASGNGVYWLQTEVSERVKDWKFWRPPQWCSKQAWFVCNPTSNSQIRVPPIPSMSIPSTSSPSFRAVCFDPLSSSCTLIWVEGGAHSKGILYVFDFGTCLWYKIVDPIAACAMISKSIHTIVFCKGNLFWVYANDGTDSKDRIGVYRVCDRIFKSLEPPYCGCHSRCSWLLGGCFRCLTLVHREADEPPLMYWMLKDHGFLEFSWEYVGVMEPDFGVEERLFGAFSGNGGHSPVVERLLGDFSGNGGYCPVDRSQWKLCTFKWMTGSMVKYLMVGPDMRLLEKLGLKMSCGFYESMVCSSNPWPAPKKDLSS